MWVGFTLNWHYRLDYTPSHGLPMNYRQEENDKEKKTENNRSNADYGAVALAHLIERRDGSLQSDFS